MEIDDQLFKEIEALIQRSLERKEHPWALHLIRVLWKYPKGCNLPFIYDNVERLRNQTSLPMPEAFEETVRSTLNSHNAQAKGFKGEPQDAFFLNPARGVWAVDHEKARAWVKRKKLGAA
jgi:hypothetical protein